MALAWSISLPSYSSKKDIIALCPNGGEGGGDKEGISINVE
jgi:hypothetical protein